MRTDLEVSLKNGLKIDGTIGPAEDNQADTIEIKDGEKVKIKIFPNSGIVFFTNEKNEGVFCTLPALNNKTGTLGNLPTTREILETQRGLDNRPELSDELIEILGKMIDSEI